MATEFSDDQFDHGLSGRHREPLVESGAKQDLSQMSSKNSRGPVPSYWMLGADGALSSNICGTKGLIVPASNWQRHSPCFLSGTMFAWESTPGISRLLRGCAMTRYCCLMSLNMFPDPAAFLKRLIRWVSQSVACDHYRSRLSGIVVELR